MNYLWHLIYMASIYSMLTVTLDILVGHLGLLVLCQSAFFASGAYTGALLMLRCGLSFPAAAVTAALVSTITATLVSVVARRLRSDAVVLASFSFLLLLIDLLKNLKQLTGGLDGIVDIPGLGVWLKKLDSHPGQALFAVCCAILTWLIAHRFSSGISGRFLHALRDDPHAAVGLGIQPLHVYARAFGLTGCISGLSGVLYASYATYINPNVFGSDTSILLISMVLVGGASTRMGPILGTLILLAMPEIIRTLGGGISAIGAINYIVMGLILVAFAVFRPKGILGGYEFR
jgi:branched-chain amino acid transport system permease protein